MTNTTATFPIAISAANEATIDAAIAQAEGRARTRCKSYSDCLVAIAQAEERLSALPKRLWVGAKVDFDDEHLPGAYKYSGESTTIYLARKTSGWVITGAERTRAKGKASADLHVSLPATAADGDLLASFLRSAGLNRALPES